MRVCLDTVCFLCVRIVDRRHAPADVAISIAPREEYGGVEHGPPLRRSCRGSPGGPAGRGE